MCNSVRQKLGHTKMGIQKLRDFIEVIPFFNVFESKLHYRKYLDCDRLIVGNFLAKYKKEPESAKLF